MKKLTLFFALLLALTGGVTLAQDDPPNLPDGLTFTQIVNGLNNGTLSIFQVRQRGLEVFTTPFNNQDGHGDGPFNPAETDNRTPLGGGRPRLQGNGQFLRVNGLDTQSCNECHTLVANGNRPPTTGIGGVGAVTQNAIIMPSVIDVADSNDNRTQYAPGHIPDLPLVKDGVADFNGRFANPPFLFGGGGVELLGKEMTADLQALLVQAKAAPNGTITNLVTKGVNFGFIRSLGGGNVELHAEGIGFNDNSAHPPEEVLVVRPFGRKGENFSMRDFDRGAMLFHFGMQPVEVVGANVDADGDGVANEVTVGEMTALHIFDVTNPRPFQEPLNNQESQGFTKFQQIGCVNCHRPMMETSSRYVPLAHPEVASDPYANVYAYIDLVQVGFQPAPGGGVLVPLFADLKRHAMGPGLAETFDNGDIPNDQFTTARLWGIGDTAPYLHDGRATTLYRAIIAHGGEAQAVRDAFLALPAVQQSRIIAFLKKLRTPIAPNEELLTNP